MDMTKPSNTTTNEKAEDEVVVPTRVFSFPSTGISVEATTLAEATKKHDQIVNKKEDGDV